jgi:uncharacterized YccA/Bax inhibitor family protein
LALTADVTRHLVPTAGLRVGTGYLEATMNGSNPVFNENTIDSLSFTRGNAMTLDGAIHKGGLLLLISIITAATSWYFNAANPASALLWVAGGGIGGFIVALVLAFKKEWAPVLAPVYAALEGCLLGGISLAYNVRSHGIAFQAAGLTLGVLGVMLVLYRFRIIRVTDQFRAILFAATGAIALVYLLTMVLGFFHVNVPYIHGSGMVGIGFSVVVVGVAAFNLLLDFDLMENAARAGAPKYMEWYCGFALLVTIVWLYLEILRLLSKLNGRRE